jgi:hypothetical protein
MENRKYEELIEKLSQKNIWIMARLKSRVVSVIIIQLMVKRNEG